jgi:pyroglutamyl-peptidase
MKLLITAFGPFEGFDINPSELLLEELKSRELEQKLNVHIAYETVPVSFLYVEKYIDTLETNFNLIIHIGVATNENKLRFEICGHNIKSGTDNDNNTYIRQEISFSEKIIHTNFPTSIINNIIENNRDSTKLSEHAGEYLCNFIYYKSLHKFHEHVPVLFIHLADIYNNPNAPKLLSQADLVEELITKFILEKRA